MSRTKAPAFQFYAMDVYMDELLGMSNESAGAYMKLLCICWRHGSLPADPVRLARMVHATSKQWGRMFHELARCFVERGGRLFNLRLDAERRKQKAYRLQQSAKGKLSAIARAAARANLGANKRFNHGSTAVLPKVKSSSSNYVVRTPLPPAAAGGGARLTRKTREHVQRIREVRGRCTHDPHCPSYDTCLQHIARELVPMAVGG